MKYLFSMDETEALCTRIGLMVNGELKCLGSLQHLKSRYGEGYSLLVKLGVDKRSDLISTNEENLIEFLLDSFENAELKEKRDGFLSFHLENNSLSSLSKIFSIIENKKAEYAIEYYAVTQTNLEQIFLNFSSKQWDHTAKDLKLKKA